MAKNVDRRYKQASHAGAASAKNETLRRESAARSGGRQRVSGKSSSRSSRTLGVSSHANEKSADQNASGKLNRVTRDRGLNSNKIYMGVGAGGVVLLLLGLMFMHFGKGKNTNETKPSEASLSELTDNASSSEWNKRAQLKESRGDRLGAADDYGKAGDAAEREGSSAQATKYNMHAYQLRKFTPLDMGGRH